MLSKKYFRLIPVYVWVFGIVIMFGMFARVYNFEDWLRFSPDQARDLTIIEEVVERGGSLPLLGPQAGNTPFYLGPIFYYFAYVSTLLFGVFPHAMAYPDLFFSLLTVPLFFFFFRKYFSIRYSLTVTALFSVSYFMVEHSRYASNVNSIPFFLLLFLMGLLGVLDKTSSERNRIYWSVLVGIGLGVGIQQHTLLIFGMPAMAGFTLFWLALERRIPRFGVVLALLVVFALNIPQIRYDQQTNGANLREFFLAVFDRSNPGKTSQSLRGLGLVVSCQIRANAHFISSVIHTEGCDDNVFKMSQEFQRRYSFLNKDIRNIWFVVILILSAIFSLGGYILWYRTWCREANDSKKRFLTLLAVYQIITLIIFVPVANETSLRYFNVLFFIPFILLGLWLTYFKELWGSKGVLLNEVLLAILILANVSSLIATKNQLAQGNGSDTETSILGELYPIADYIVQYADPNREEIFFTGKRQYRKRFFAPLKYILRQQDRILVSSDSEGLVLAHGTQVFYVAKTSGRTYHQGEIFEGGIIESYRVFRSITIFVLRK